MAFWASRSSNRKRTSEPKRNYRWLLYMGGIEPWVAKKVTKPSFEFMDGTTQRVHGYTVEIPGMPYWKDVKVTLVDPGHPDLTQTLYDMLKAAGLTFPEGDAERIGISQDQINKSLGRVMIQQIGDQARSTADQGQFRRSEGKGFAYEILEEWVLYNAWPKSIDFGSLDYNSDDIVEIELTISYDYAKLNTDNKVTSLKKNPKGFKLTNDK